MRPNLLFALLALPLPVLAADIDRSIADFRTPAEIRWVRNPAGTNEQAILYGDPSKPGPYVVRLKWLAGQHEPASFPSERPLFRGDLGYLVGGHGDKFDPENTVPVPAGSYVSPLREQDPLRRREGRGVRDPGVGHGPGHLDAGGAK
jgi:hypothetical protein